MQFDIRVLARDERVMRLMEFSQPHAFLKSTSAFLMGAEAENNLLLSSAITLARASAAGPPHDYFAMVSGAAVKGAAMNVARRKLLLSRTDRDSAHFLAEEFARRQADVRAVLGPSLAAETFCQVDSSLERSQILLQFQLRASDLGGGDQKLPRGLWRVAREKDSRLLYNWTRSFIAEQKHDESKEESKELIYRYIENRQLFVWEDDDSAPVAMAGFSGLTPNGSRINMVYTDPKARGRGYAGALVGALSRKLLVNRERKFCFLFVDFANAGAIRVYERLGYRNLGMFLEYKSRGRHQP